MYLYFYIHGECTSIAFNISDLKDRPHKAQKGQVGTTELCCAYKPSHCNFMESRLHKALMGLWGTSDLYGAWHI